MYAFTSADVVAQHQGQFAGSTLTLQPSALSWVVLGANCSDWTAVSVMLDGTLSNVYILASDFESNSWKFVSGPRKNAGQVPLPHGNMRADGITYVAILCPDNGTAEMTVSLLLTGGTPPGVPVTGTVRTSAAQPLPDVAMKLTGPYNFDTTSQADGTYTFASVPPGNYTLTALVEDCDVTPAVDHITVAAQPVVTQDFTATLNMAGITPYAFKLSYGAGQSAVVRPAAGTNLDVYVEPGTGVVDWYPSYDAAFKDAMLDWNSFSDRWGLFHLRVTNNPADAEIKVNWVVSLGGPTLGYTSCTFSGGKITLPITTQMATHNQFGSTNYWLVRKIAVHEIGHAVGLWQHSDETTDIMYPFVSTFEWPSKRDQWTLYTLYHTPADFTTSGRGPSSTCHDPVWTYGIF